MVKKDIPDLSILVRTLDQIHTHFLTQNQSFDLSNENAEEEERRTHICEFPLDILTIFSHFVVRGLGRISLSYLPLSSLI